jgi:hypothetical protein
LIAFANFTLINRPIVYGFASTLPKLAIINIYYDIFSNVRWARWTLVALTLTVLANIVAYILAALCNCRPIAATWDKSIDGQCGDRRMVYSMTSLPNIVTDLAIILIPIPIISKLKMSRRVKLGVLATFLTGSVYVSNLPFQDCKYDANDC